MCIPLIAIMVHKELLAIDKKQVFLEEATSALTPTLHVVVELEYVVVNKQGVSHLDWPVIIQWH